LVIQVTSDGTDGPIRHTVSSLGAVDEDDDPLLPLEPQPVRAMAAAAHAAATVVSLYRTLESSLQRL
jgi:hypothetical protein